MLCGGLVLLSSVYSHHHSYCHCYPTPLLLATLSPLLLPLSSPHSKAASSTTCANLHHTTRRPRPPVATNSTGDTICCGDLTATVPAGMGTGRGTNDTAGRGANCALVSKTIDSARATLGDSYGLSLFGSLRAGLESGGR